MVMMQSCAQVHQASHRFDMSVELVIQITCIKNLVPTGIHLLLVVVVLDSSCAVLFILLELLVIIMAGWHL